MEAQLKVLNNEFMVKVPYEGKDVIKQIVDSYKWLPDHKAWKIPTSLEAMQAIKQNFTLNLTEEALAIIADLILEQKRIDYIEMIKKDVNWRLDGRLNYLYRHQCIAFEAAKNFPQYALFLDTGTGKTLTSIEIIKHYNLKTLVVCPLSIIESAWLDDIKKFAPELKAISLWDKTKAQRLRRLEIKSQVYIINFEGFKMLQKELEKANFQIIIIDESSKMKNNKSQITKALLDFSNKINYRYILSGSPAPNSPLEFWAQMAFVDPNLLGDNFYRFRNNWFYQSDWSGYQYSITPPNKEKLMRKIGRKAIFFAKDDCLDLPDKTYVTRKIEMSDVQKAAYQQMKDDLLLEIEGKTIIASNQIAKIMKLRQVTSGYIYDESRGTIKISDTKFNELFDVLDEIGDRQVIIWIQFHFEGVELMKHFKEKACALWGDVKAEDRITAINQFKSGQKQYLIANPATAAHGLTFTNCQYSIYFSLSYSAELWKQSQERIHRIGQAKNVTYIYLICKDSIDEKIYTALQGKKKISDECLNWLK